MLRRTRLRAQADRQGRSAIKISIVTVCFNSVATIGDTIASVRNQTHPDVEHIVIDGASRDGTADLVRSRLREGDVLISEPDRGIYDAMNKGIARATGSIIGLLNADDFFADPRALSWVAEAFDRRPELEASLGDIAFVDPERANVVTRRYRSGTFTPGKVRWGWMPAHPGMYLTRAAYEKVGPYRTDYRIAADYEFVVRAFACHGLVFEHLPRCLVHMRSGGASTAGWDAKWRINIEAVRACRDNGIYTNLPMIMSKYPLKLAELLR